MAALKETVPRGNENKEVYKKGQFGILNKITKVIIVSKAILPVLLAEGYSNY